MGFVEDCDGRRSIEKEILCEVQCMHQNVVQKWCLEESEIVLPSHQS